MWVALQNVVGLAWFVLGALVSRLANLPGSQVFLSLPFVVAID